MSRFVRVPEARTTPWGGRALKKVLVVEDEASIAGLLAYNPEFGGERQAWDMCEAVDAPARLSRADNRHVIIA